MPQLQRQVFLGSIVVLLLIVGLLPLFSMLFKSMIIDGHFSLEAYRGLLASRHQWVLMRHSLALSSWVTLLTLLVGVPLGVILGKTDLPLRRTFAVLFVTPLLIPSYIVAVSWFDLLGSEGLLADLLGNPVAQMTNSFLFSLSGCVAVLFTIFLPIPMLLTMIFLRTIDPSLEEAGRLVSGWFGVLKGISIPLILPAVLLAAMLVFLLSFGEFSVPAYLRYDVFPVESFTQFSAFYHFQAATAAAVPLVAVTLLLLLAEALFLQEKTYPLRPSATIGRSMTIALGPYRKGVFVLITLLGFVIVILPIVVLLIESAGMDAYREALDRAGGSLLHSLYYAALGATLLTFVGFFVGYLIHHRTVRYWRMIDSVTIFLFALPGTVIGIGLISLWNTPWTNFVYATPMIIILGYLAKYTALTSRITAAQLAQISPSMEEAAQVAGAGWFRRMVLIVIPLSWRALLAGWIVGYLFSLRDTEITMLVYPPGYETLPVRIYTLMANGSPQLIAALCIIMISAALLPAALLWMLYHTMTTKEIK
ncbi:MAG TPA: iron ABC transporter permease [Epsilonproteobacteria bacterium]|nr:iron ABC transporter permease [Campylobacterota bacterium]